MGGRLGGQKLHWQSPKRLKFKSTLSLKSGAKISKIIHVSISLCTRTWMDNWYKYFHHSWIYIFLDRVYIAAFILLLSLFMKLFGLKHYVQVYHYICDKEFYPEINCLQTIIFHSSPGFLAARVKKKMIKIDEIQHQHCGIFLLLLVLRYPYLRTKNAGSKKCIERSQKGRNSFSWGCGQKENDVFSQSNNLQPDNSCLITKLLNDTMDFLF